MGTSKKDYNLVGVNKDHPHACGDKSVRVEVLSSVTGSSPRVWGQGVYNDICMHAYRIIPTRVGTSSGLKAVCGKS